MQPEIEAGLLTGGSDRPYALGLAKALISKGVRLDFIGSDELDSPELHDTPKLNFLNLRGSTLPEASLLKKVTRVLTYYLRLLGYASLGRPQVFHILWNNKFPFFDRTLLMLYYKLLRKKVALTAHNVNAGKRDINDSVFNRLTLRIQYRLADHIFVHTEKMKNELLDDFGVRERAVTVVPFGINNCVPCTSLTPVEAKERLGIAPKDRTILFFGNIGPYKGLEHLVTAFQRIATGAGDFRMIIAGKPRAGCRAYLDKVLQTARQHFEPGRILLKIEYIPDSEVELYFKAADVFVLPYLEVSQSGVLFLGYSFGLPVIATDVGSLKEDIVEGRTGLLCRPGDPAHLAETINRYFESDLYDDLDRRREEIRGYANARHSWVVVAEMTRQVYVRLLGRIEHETSSVNPHSCVQHAGMDR